MAKKDKGNKKAKPTITMDGVYAVPKTTMKVLIGVVSVCSSIIIGIGSWMALTLYDLNHTVKANYEAINDENGILKRLEKIETGLYGDGETDGIYTRLSLVEDKLSTVEDKLNTPTIAMSDDITSFVDEATIEDNNVISTTSSIPSELCIGTDADGNVYMAEDLINETVLLTYTEDGNEVYFLGQYNENYHWDGYCVTNEYNADGTLLGICESNFDDGKRLDYKSFCKMDSGEWILSDKVCEESGNIGTNIEYSLNYGEVKNFTSTNVRIVDILYVDYFLENVDTVISKYYYGKTSDGLYNDDTGNAYYVKYAEDGTVRTLYCGKFKNGKFHDNTNDSWYITKNDDTDYMYYKGKFDMNEKVKNEGHDFENPVTVEHIQEIIKDKRFKCDLKWYE